jgi:hypothetical protein
MSLDWQLAWSGRLRLSWEFTSGFAIKLRLCWMRFVSSSIECKILIVSWSMML